MDVNKSILGRIRIPKLGTTVWISILTFDLLSTQRLLFALLYNFLYLSLSFLFSASPKRNIKASTNLIDRGLTFIVTPYPVKYSKRYSCGVLPVSLRKAELK